MVYTSAFGFYPKAPLPVISVAKADALLLRRLLAKGPVKLSLDVRNTFDTSPYRERNVIADLPGRDAGEVVLIGAHYDSWDPAEGADDDGSGVAAVLEAARILKSLGVDAAAHDPVRVLLGRGGGHARFARLRRRAREGARLA